jgi:hypothetical protein
VPAAVIENPPGRGDALDMIAVRATRG